MTMRILLTVASGAAVIAALAPAPVAAQLQSQMFGPIPPVYRYVDPPHRAYRHGPATHRHAHRSEPQDAAPAPENGGQDAAKDAAKASKNGNGDQNTPKASENENGDRM